VEARAGSVIALSDPFSPSRWATGGAGVSNTKQIIMAKYDKERQAIIDTTKALAAFGRDDVSARIIGAIQKNDREQAFALAHYRMTLWMESIVACNDVKHFQVVCAAARSLFEHLLDVTLLAKRRADDVDRFWQFTLVKRHDLCSKLWDLLKRERKTLDRGDCQREIRFATNRTRKKKVAATRLRFWPNRKGKGANPPHWSGLNNAALARRCGPKIEKLYRQEYGKLSLYLHPGAAGFDGIKPESYESLFILSAQFAGVCYVEGTQIVCDELKLFAADKSLGEKRDQILHDALERLAIAFKADF